MTAKALPRVRKQLDHNLGEQRVWSAAKEREYSRLWQKAAPKLSKEGPRISPDLPIRFVSSILGVLMFCPLLIPRAS